MSEKKDSKYEEFTLEDAIVFVSALQNQYKDKRCIFRGTSKVYTEATSKNIYHDNDDYDGINSNLYRSVVYAKSADGEKKHEPDRIFNEYYSPVNAEEEVVKKARRLFPSHSTNIDILIEIQHYKGRTNMIDFTENLCVALFFACNGEFDETAELLLLDTENIKPLSILDYDNKNDLSDINIIKPSGYASEKRILVQSSIFIYPKQGYIDKSKLCIEKIDSEKKKILLEYLDCYHNINSNTIYNDILGFIENEKNYESAQLFFHRGNAKAKQGEYAAAILDYDGAIRLDPKDAEAYNNRGNVKAKQGEYAAAILDYDKALRLAPEDAEAYNNRGVAKYELEQYAEAIEDLLRALELDPKLIQSHFVLVKAYLALDQLKEAEEYYTMLLSLDKNTADQAKQAIDEYKNNHSS